MRCADAREKATAETNNLGGERALRLRQLRPSSTPLCTSSRIFSSCGRELIAPMSVFLSSGLPSRANGLDAVAQPSDHLGIIPSARTAAPRRTEACEKMPYDALINRGLDNVRPLPSKAFKREPLERVRLSCRKDLFQVIKKLRDRIQTLRVGNPLDKKTRHRRINSRPQLEKNPRAVAKAA